MEYNKKFLKSVKAESYVSDKIEKRFIDAKL